MGRRERALLIILIAASILLVFVHFKSKMHVEKRQWKPDIQEDPLSVIGDPKLRQCVAEALKKTATGRYEDILELTTLRPGNSRTIDEFTGLDKLLPNLRVLRANCFSSDISLIFGLQYLEELYISDYSNESLDGIQKLQNLRELQISVYNSESAESLSKLSHLEKLMMFTYNSVAVQLTDLPNLRELRIYNCDGIDNNLVEEMIPCLKAVNLEKIEIDTDSTESISTIAMYKNLRTLVIEGKVNTLEPISKLPHLQEIYYSGYPAEEYMNRETDILEWCSRDVKTIYVAGDYLHDERITEFTSLERLAVIRARDIDIAPLRQLANLRELQLSGMQIENFADVMQFPSLEKLYLFDVKNVTDEMLRDVEKKPNFRIIRVRRDYDDQIPIPRIRCARGSSK